MNTFKELQELINGANFVRYLSHHAHDAVLYFEKPYYFNEKDRSSNRNDFIFIRLVNDAGRVGIDVEITSRRNAVDEKTGLTLNKFECGATQRHFIKCTRKSHDKLRAYFEPKFN